MVSRTGGRLQGEVMLRGLHPGTPQYVHYLLNTSLQSEGCSGTTEACDNGSGIAEAGDVGGPYSTGLCLGYRVLVLIEWVTSDGGGRV